MSGGIEALAMAEDRVAALDEFRRILRPGGRAMITGGQALEPVIEQASFHVISRFEDRRGTSAGSPSASFASTMKQN
jgi:ubiquinone/menaquinone biosynthesis C-methylase UbiE